MIVVAVVAVAVDVVVSVATVVAVVADAVADVAVLVVTVAAVVVAVVVSTSPAVLDDLDQNDPSGTYGALKHISLKHDELDILESTHTKESILPWKKRSLSAVCALSGSMKVFLLSFRNMGDHPQQSQRVLFGWVPVI